MKRRFTRIAALPAIIAAMSLAISASAASAPALASPSATTGSGSTTAEEAPAAIAARWLADNLSGKSHNHFSDIYKGTAYPDYGNTEDGILAMDAAHVAQSAAKKMTKWLAGNIDGYVDATCGNKSTFYPGALAKASIVAEAQGKNPESFGGVDLIKDLQREQSASPSDKGLYGADPSCTYSSPITQSLAIIAMARLHKASVSAVQWLARQRCADGGYVDEVRTNLKTACTKSDEDVDTTAFAIQALTLVRVRGDSAHKSIEWLAAAQRKDGGFGDTAATENTNSTAIAVQALFSSNKRADARRAQEWILGQQLRCHAKSSERGSLDYEKTYVAGSTQLTATTQGTQALAGGLLDSISKKGASRPVPAAETC